MDFFEHQDRPGARPARCWWLFVAGGGCRSSWRSTRWPAVILRRLTGSGRGREPRPRVARAARRHAAGATLMVGLGSLVQDRGSLRRRRRRGGRLRCSAAGRVEPARADPAERRLLNVVEEMALASGRPGAARSSCWTTRRASTPSPPGSPPGDAVIGGHPRLRSTSLTRDELQGVIAHEFSHILNGDMRLNLRLIGLLHGILVLAAHRLLRHAHRDGASSRRAAAREGRRRRPRSAWRGGAAGASGYVGVFFGKLIKAAVSRQREFLADASAVQFTRNPAGLAGALKKIGGYERRLEIVDAPRRDEPLLLRQRVAGSFFSIFCHPPAARGADPAARPAASSGAFPEIPVELPGAARRGNPGPGRRVRRGGVPSAGRRRGGCRKRWDNHRRRDQLRRRAPQVPAAGTFSGRADLRGARAILLGMLFDARPEIRTIQRQFLGLDRDATAPAAVGRFLPLLDSLDPPLSLPLADLAVASLRTLEIPSIRRFVDEVEALVSADGRIFPARTDATTMIARRLRPLLGPPARGSERRGWEGSLLRAARSSSARSPGRHRKTGGIRRSTIWAPGNSSAIAGRRS